MFDGLLGKRAKPPTPEELRQMQFLSQQRIDALGGIGAQQQFMSMANVSQSSQLQEVVELLARTNTKIKQLRKEIRELKTKLKEADPKEVNRVRAHNKKLLERLTYYEANHE